MSFVILDLEWNTAFCKELDRHVNEIIEFGAVKLDDALNITGSFSAFVKPTVATEINSQVKDMIPVDFDELQNSPKTFPYILDDFADFLGDSTLITWSNADIFALLSNSELHFMDDNLPFVKSFCDLQRYCEYALGVSSESRHLGLLSCAEILGISHCEKQIHRACDDAQLSLKCLKLLYSRRIFEEFIEVCDKNFYRKLRFKDRFILNAKDNEIERQKLFFDCPDCRIRCVRKSKWSRKNRCVYAYFVCPECKRSFKGKARAKLKYDGVVIVTKELKEELPAQKGG